MSTDPEHVPHLGWRDMPMEDRDEADADEREARAKEREEAHEPTWRDRVREASSFE